MAVFAVDRLTYGLERKTPSFFALLSVIWATSVAIVSIAVLIASAQVSANRIDQEKQNLTNETIEMIATFARDMNRAEPHEFIIDVMETGHFRRVGVYCTMQNANFEGRPDRGVVKSETPPDLARHTVESQTATTIVSATEISISRPLFASNGQCNGAIYMTVDRTDIDALLETLVREMAPVVLAILVGGLLACTMLAYGLTAPMRALTASSRRIAAGELDTEVKASGPAEFRTLANSVSSMVGHMRSNLEKINRLAFVDNVTDLPNRAAFQKLGDQATSGHRRIDGEWVALLFIDLDGFKAVNDSHGHAYGDAALRFFANGLTETLRETDEILGGVGPNARKAHSTPARIGGDEFTVLLTGLERDADAEIVAQRILSIVAKPVMVDGIEMKLGASIGIAVGKAEDADFEQMLLQADQAMYEVKRAGKNAYRRFSESI